jgi:hypothetical protein
MHYPFLSSYLIEINLCAQSTLVNFVLTISFDEISYDRKNVWVTEWDGM